MIALHLSEEKWAVELPSKESADCTANFALARSTVSAVSSCSYSQVNGPRASIANCCILLRCLSCLLAGFGMIPISAACTLGGWVGSQDGMGNFSSSSLRQSFLRVFSVTEFRNFTVLSLGRYFLFSGTAVSSSSDFSEPSSPSHSPSERNGLTESSSGSIEGAEEVGVAKTGGCE